MGMWVRLGWAGWILPRIGWGFNACGPHWVGHPIWGRCVPDWVGQAGVPLWVGQAADAPLWVGQSGPISLHTCIHTAFGDPPTTAVFTPVFTPLFTRLYSHLYSHIYCRPLYSHLSSLLNSHLSQHGAFVAMGNTSEEAAALVRGRLQRGVESDGTFKASTARGSGAKGQGVQTCTGVRRRRQLMCGPRATRHGRTSRQRPPKAREPRPP